MQTIKNSAGKFFVFLASAILFGACRPPGVRGLLAGEKLLEQGKYAQAAEELRSAAALLGNTNALSFNYLGLACHHAGQSAEAEKDYRRALALNPDLVEAHYNLGCLLLAQNKWEAAKTELVAYTLRRGTAVEGWVRLGIVQLRLSNSGTAASRASELSGAEKSFEEALHLNPQNAECLNGLGLVRLRRNHAAEAANFFSRALKQQPGYGPAVLNLAIVAQQNLNQPQMALEKYQEYLQLKPPQAEVEGVIAIVNQLKARLAPAARSVATNHVTGQTITSAPNASLAQLETVHLAPSHRTLLSNSAHTAFARGNEPDPNSLKPAQGSIVPPPAGNTESAGFSNTEIVKLAAEPVFKPAEDVDATPNSSPPPSEPSPAIASGGNAEKTPKPSKRTLLQRLNPINLFTADTKPSSPTPLPGSTADQIASVEAGSSPAEPVARYQYESPQRPAAGKRREAERVFAEAVHAQQIQQLPEAIKDYQRAADLDPSFYDAHYNLGLAATQAGELPLALRAYETALAIRPDSLDARYNFALVLKQSNYAVDSAHELQKIIADSPDESRAHLALGNLYAQQFHDLAKARPHYLKVLESDPHNPQADAIRVWLAGHPR